MITGGQRSRQMADLFGEDRRMVQHWVKTSTEAHGLDGLREGECSGRPRSVDACQWAVLGKDIRLRVMEFGYEAGLLDSKLLS